VKFLQKQFILIINKLFQIVVAIIVFLIYCQSLGKCSHCLVHAGQHLAFLLQKNIHQTFLFGKKVQFHLLTDGCFHSNLKCFEGHNSQFFRLADQLSGAQQFVAGLLHFSNAFLGMHCHSCE
jgi:hypothetical protein